MIDSEPLLELDDRGCANEIYRGCTRPFNWIDKKSPERGGALSCFVNDPSNGKLGL